LGVQMPQLGLQHDVPGAQIVPPHDAALGASASVAGTGSDRGAAGAGHSGHSRAQIGVPVQPMHNLRGGRHVSAAVFTGAAAGLGVARDASGDPAHAASASAIDATRIMRRGLRDSFPMGTPSLATCEDGAPADRRARSEDRRESRSHQQHRGW
jgi:hypothetical protein